MAADLRKVAMASSLAVAFLMLGGKVFAYLLTGSAAIFSDAAESVIHVVATGIAAMSLWYASFPPDRNHPYGHGKIAYFSAGFEGALILCAGVCIITLAVWDLVVGPELHRLGLGLAITASLGLGDLGLGLFLIHVGRTQNVLILVSNGKHVLTDMWTSLGVVVGVSVVWATGIVWLDPLVAIAVGANILVSAANLIRRSFQGLLDEADGAQTQTLLEHLNEAVARGTLSGFHQLRHRQTDNVMWIELHVLLPDEMANAEAHRRVTEVEKSMKDHFPDYVVHITTHVEPASHDRAHPEGHEGMVSPYDGDKGST